MNAEEMGVVFARDYFPWILGAIIGFIASLITDRRRRKKQEEQNSLTSRIDDRAFKRTKQQFITDAAINE